MDFNQHRSQITYEEDMECQHETCEWQNVGQCGYCDEHCECGEGLQLV